MKKNYIHPQMQVAEMQCDTVLLAGSGQETQTRMQFGGDADDDDYAY